MISSPSRFLAPSFIVLFSCLGPLAAVFSDAQIQAYPDCLNVSPTSRRFNPVGNRNCVKDTLNFAEDKVILDDERLLRISPKQVRFIGCGEAPFVTFPALGLSNSQFTIYYPTGAQLKHDDYLAPLLHELGHVFQMKEAGGYAKLKDSVSDSIERIELGADFIAGFGADRLGLEPSSFLLNLSLVGSYNNRDLDNHGRPEDRAAAFRQGYFYKDKQTTIVTSYADFQDNRFAQIKNQ